jgi:lauroyl/myristoyl acyltransferase
VFSRVVLPEDLDGLDASQVMVLVNRETERLILACPEQYFWLHDRYKGLPRDL